jgi:hypothetical protein
MEKLKACCKNCVHGMSLSRSCKIYTEMRNKYGFEQWEKIKEFSDVDRADSGCEYKCRYIEYPLTVLNGISTESIMYNGQSKIGSLVKVKVCSDDKTYLGLYLGELPTSINTSYSTIYSTLTIKPSMYNPALLIPELNKIVFGYESYWGFIKSEEDFKDITNSDINNIWYVKALKNLAEQSDEEESE